MSLAHFKVTDHQGAVKAGLKYILKGLDIGLVLFLAELTALLGSMLVDTEDINPRSCVVRETTLLSIGKDLLKKHRESSLPSMTDEEGGHSLVFRGH